MKIPEDIMVRAEAAYDALGRGCDADAQVIARAILAERRRCIDVYREARDWDYFLAAEEAIEATPCA